jgi:hypothetical protein
VHVGSGVGSGLLDMVGSGVSTYRRPCGLLMASCSGMKWPCSGPNAPSALPSTSNRRSSVCRALTAMGGAVVRV